MNRQSALITALTAAGLEAYPPGSHEGICRAPYCVVRLMSGVLRGGRGGCARYRVYLYAPADRAELLDTLAESARAALHPLEESGVLALAEPRGATAVDDLFRAVCSYIDYVSYYTEH